MKNFLPRIIFTTAGALALAVLPARAGHDEEEGNSLFDQIDTNGDGHITRAEHAASARKRFAAMDANHDGFVTAAEMDALQAQRKDAAIRFSVATPVDGATRDPGSGAARADGSVSPQEVANARGSASTERDSAGKIRLMDRDGDGRLSAAEYEAAAAAMFARLDTNGDGQLSRAECAANPSSWGEISNRRPDRP
jgi:Ca2+-binding EF-hand superfamily protein